MSTYRIYVDSREREDVANSSNTDFEIALPFSLSIKEKSLAMIDVVCVPMSIRTVTENKNDLLWLKEMTSFGNFQDRFAKIAPGYYTVQTLTEAIQLALNTRKFLFGNYTVGYDERLACYTFNNPFTVNGESFTLYTAQSLEKPVPPTYPAIVGDDYGAFRQVGLIEGEPLFCNINTVPVSATGTLFRQMLSCSSSQI